MKNIKRLLIMLLPFVAVACSQGEKTILQGNYLTAYEQPALSPETTIGCSEVLPDSANQWVAFRKDIHLDKVPEAAVTRISADSKYWLWINGELAVFEGMLKRGPSPKESYYDEIDIAPMLKKGDNQIALLLWYFGKDGFSHKSSGTPQLWFDCPQLQIASDESWLCRVHPSYGTANCPQPNYRLSESSIAFDARKDIEGWQTTTPPEGFSSAVILPNTLGKLRMRPIPQWKDFGVKDVSFQTLKGEQCDTVVATLPHNIQMTPILRVNDQEGGHHILIETNHAKVGEECLRAEYITKSGQQEYESLGWLNGNILRLTVEHGAEVTGVAYRETGYDTAAEGTFSCSNPFFNLMWEKGLRTIYVNARDNFFDCPDRERGQWWGDIVVILNECFYTYTPSLHALIKKGIHELVDWQKDDGALLAPIPGNYDVELPCQMLAAVGKYGFWTYYMNTGDLETIKHVYPAVKRYIGLYETEPNGFPKFRRGGWPWGDWGDNRDMRLLQATWYCLALEGVANMAEALGYADEATAYRKQHDAVSEAVNRVCWTGTCYRHPDYTDATDDRVQALAVLSGIACSDKYEALFKVLQTEEHASPYMEKYVMEALFEMGYGWYGLERTKKRFDHIVNHPDYDTLFEGWDVGVNGNWDCGSVNHAWSGGALAVIPTKMFGIVPTQPAWKRFSIRPHDYYPESSLSFPTVSGTIAVSIKETPTSYRMDVTVPDSTIADVSLPENMSNPTVDGKAIPDSQQELSLQGGRHTIKGDYVD